MAEVKQNENPRGSFLPARFTSFAAAILIPSIKTTQQVGLEGWCREYDLGASASRTSIDRAAIVHFTLQSVRGVLLWP
jgi:hypothetical protein